MVAQLLDYGSWAADLSGSDIRAIFQAYRPETDFDSAFTERFGERPPEHLNTGHKLTIAAHDADAAMKRIVQYMSTYGVPVSILFFRYYYDDNRHYLIRSRLSDEDAPTVRPSTQSKRPLWNGSDWYVALGGKTSKRSWDDARQYGFVSAGALRHSSALRKIPPGSRIFVHIPKEEYVGVGEVTGEAVMFPHGLWRSTGSRTG
ncbi:hypothetical protein LO762_09650 [Actinocorallia sp. API 0066]|uniref:hypothetical protein n=1 Tax=Actinocorallia sp. API 0066 TaxID=2896846 RepID=UPI001E438EE3|nr:hypothetical protein [Actinocorallia sp. API 0066]MCD0449452.1 hypothetical protein [Actinocorallia sp. API 0066]